MTVKEAKYVLGTIDNEGLDYAFQNYSDFYEIKDEEFHRLRVKYIDAASDLEKYVEEASTKRVKK